VSPLNLITLQTSELPLDASCIHRFIGPQNKLANQGKKIILGAKQVGLIWRIDTIPTSHGHGQIPYQHRKADS
jgi:hypothetical protein